MSATLREVPDLHNARRSTRTARRGALNPRSTMRRT